MRYRKAIISEPIALFISQTGNDADLVVVVDCQIPTDDLVVHNL